MMLLGDPQGDVIGQITPSSNSYCNFFLISSTSKMDYLHKQIFGNGEFGNNYILFSTSLLEGNTSGSYNTSLFSWKIFSNLFFFSLLHPSRDAFTFTNSFNG